MPDFAAECAEVDHHEQQIAVVNRQDPCDKIVVDTYHVSCQSDKVNFSDQYAGIVLYSKDGATQWKCGGVKCRSGYIYITNSAGLMQQFPNETGMVHGAAYKKLFKESMSGIVGSGFSIQQGKFVFRSWSMNAFSDKYHNEAKEMNDLEKHVVTQALRQWFISGQSNQNHKVSELKQLPRTAAELPGSKQLPPTAAELPGSTASCCIQ